MNDTDKIMLIRSWVPKFDIFQSEWVKEWTTRLPMLGLLDIPTHHDDYSTALDVALRTTHRRIFKLVWSIEESKSNDKQ